MKCPVCQRTISDQAVVCRHCQAQIPATPDSPSRGGWVCTRCGFHGDRRRYTPGSFMVEVLLWCLLIVPGLCYSVWRLTARYRGCPECGSPDVIPASSPRAREFVS